jgi:hypothetical protein
MNLLGFALGEELSGKILIGGAVGRMSVHDKSRCLRGSGITPYN